MKVDSVSITTAAIDRVKQNLLSSLNKAEVDDTKLFSQITQVAGRAARERLTEVRNADQNFANSHADKTFVYISVISAFIWIIK